MNLSITSKPIVPCYPSYHNKNHHYCSNRVFFVVSCISSSSSSSSSPKNKTNFYRMLSLSTEKVSTEEIKKAYRSMALRHHPDVCHDPSKKEGSTKVFAELNEAYHTLSDPVLREEYDYEMGYFSRRTIFKVDLNHDDHVGRKRKWQQQIFELKTRSNSRMDQKEGGSWGCRMRTKY